MGIPYPVELRKRVVDFVEEGHSHREAAKQFNVAISFVNGMVKLKRRTGELKPARQGRPPNKSGKLLNCADFFSEILTSDPDITLCELTSALEDAKGIQVHITSIHYALIRAGITYKKRLDCG